MALSPDFSAGEEASVMAIRVPATTALEKVARREAGGLLAASPALVSNEKP